MGWKRLVCCLPDSPPPILSSHPIDITPSPSVRPDHSLHYRVNSSRHLATISPSDIVAFRSSRSKDSIGSSLGATPPRATPAPVVRITSHAKENVRTVREKGVMHAAKKTLGTTAICIPLTTPTLGIKYNDPSPSTIDGTNRHCIESNFPIPVEPPHRRHFTKQPESLSLQSVHYHPHPRPRSLLSEELRRGIAPPEANTEC